jgi:hypothetical protein
MLNRDRRRRLGDKSKDPAFVNSNIGGANMKLKLILTGKFMKESIELCVTTGKFKAIIISPKLPNLNLHTAPAWQVWAALAFRYDPKSISRRFARPESPVESPGLLESRPAH